MEADWFELLKVVLQATSFLHLMTSKSFTKGDCEFSLQPSKVERGKPRRRMPMKAPSPNKLLNAQPSLS